MTKINDMPEISRTTQLKPINNDWNPGHDLVKGYPYDGIRSKEAYKFRMEADIAENGKPYLVIDKDIFPEAPDFVDQGLTEQESFLLNRIIDYKKSLEIAEDQIAALLEERPFIPEDLNFELLYKNKEVTEPPVRIYGPKSDPDFSIYRKPGSSNDPNWNPAIWTLQINRDGTQKEIDLVLPCRRIAYAVLSAFGINMNPIEGEGSEAPIKEESPEDMGTIQ